MADLASTRSLGKAYVDGTHLSEEAKRIIAAHNAAIIRRGRARLGLGS
jgi:hypothetical protein